MLLSQLCHLLVTKLFHLQKWVNYFVRGFLTIKQTRCTNFSNLFWNETLHVLDSSSVHNREFFTVHTAMIYVIQVCWQLAGRIKLELQFHPHPACKLWANLYDISLLCTQWKTPDDGQWNCPERAVSVQEEIWEISASSWSYYKNFHTMHGQMNVKFMYASL